MENQTSNSAEKAGKSKTGVIIFIAAVIIVALVAVIVFLVLNMSKPAEEPAIEDTADGRGVVLTPENMDEVLNAEKVSEGYFETCMTNDWTFVNGVSSEEDVYVKNVETNTRTIYFDLLVGDSSEPVYSSPYIPVGAELPSFTLTGDLEKGDYDGTVVYHLVDENNQEISDVSVAVTLHIK